MSTSWLDTTYRFVRERVYKRVPGLAVGLEDAGVVLSLPPAAALDVGAVAVGRVRAEPTAALAEGEALPIPMDATDAAEAGLPTDPFLADVGTLREIKLTSRHGSI